MNSQIEYERWLSCVTDDDMVAELAAMSKADIQDSFYQQLSFGTGGLRGIIGLGTNRMNVFTVARATQGVANYLKKHFDSPSVAISFDSRHMSKDFAAIACNVLAANKILTYRYSELMPTPCLSYAVRQLSCSAGIMITASHNPAEYNGYKVYDRNGCQITEDTASEITAEIKTIDYFEGNLVHAMHLSRKDDFNRLVPHYVIDEYIDTIKSQSLLYGDLVDKDICIVYSPLNGTGLKPVTHALNEMGFTNVHVVSEQSQPDGSFPTCPKPNPENAEAMRLGLQYCHRYNADVLIATDPDCDRCGVAVSDGLSMQLLTGNEVAILLLDYVCSQRHKHGKMPVKPVAIKTIVTSHLAELLAQSYGVEVLNVLTGFKYIGETICRLEDMGKADSFILGFEESCGYLSGSFVRDKDGVNAATLICEMVGYHKHRGTTMQNRLNAIYAQFGYCTDRLLTYEFLGEQGAHDMHSLINHCRMSVRTIGGEAINEMLDYSTGIGNLPKSNVIKLTANHLSLIVRPSGTEPKLKIYVSVFGLQKNEAQELMQTTVDEANLLVKGFME